MDGENRWLVFTLATRNHCLGRFSELVRQTKSGMDLEVGGLVFTIPTRGHKLPGVEIYLTREKTPLRPFC
jgi:hypothetical protein